MTPTTSALASLLATFFAAAPSASPAARALRRGDLASALAEPAANGEEAGYIRARVDIARGELSAAEREGARLPAGGVKAAQIAWYLAHARGDGPAIGRAAARLCRLGDRTGRACADSELYGRPPPAPQVALSAPTEVPLSTTAPVPVALVRAGGSRTGMVIDSGASETVISVSLARALGLRTTRAAFPVGVAAGGSRTEARLAVLPSLAVGGLTVHDLPVLVVDLGELERVGVFGIVSPQQAFAGVTATLDLGRHRLHLAPGSAPVRSDATHRAVTVPYRLAGFDLAVEARVGDGPTSLFGLDTGMQGAFAVSDAYAATGVFPLEASAVRGAGGQAALPSLPPLPVKLGDATLAADGRRVLAPSARNDLGLAGLLGNALWKNGVVVLDNATRQVTVLLPNASEERPPRSGGRSPEL